MTAEQKAALLGYILQGVSAETALELVGGSDAELIAAQEDHRFCEAYYFAVFGREAVNRIMLEDADSD